MSNLRQRIEALEKSFNDRGGGYDLHMCIMPDEDDCIYSIVDKATGERLQVDEAEFTRTQTQLLKTANAKSRRIDLKVTVEDD